MSAFKAWFRSLVFNQENMELSFKQCWDAAIKSMEQNPDSPASPVQHLQAEIRALHDEFRELYDGDFGGEAVSLLLTKMLELSVVQSQVVRNRRINYEKL